MAERRKAKKRSFVIRAVVMLLPVCIGLMIISHYTDSKLLKAEATEILPGVSVGGVSLSNLERQDGIKRLAELEQEISSKTVEIVYNENVHSVTLGQLGLSLDNEETVDQALALSTKMGLLKRWEAQLRPVERNLQPVIHIDSEKVRQVLQGICGALEQKAVNARLEIAPGDQIIVEPAKDGYTIDEELFSSQLVDQVQSNKNLKLNLPVRVVKSKITEEDVQSWGVTGLTGVFTTNFNAQQTNRTHNIATAAAALDGVLIKPGETLSFNQVVGPRGAKEGYKPANVIVGNKFEEDWGGGVCQVSTTLYNAILLAGLDVKERSSHSLPVSYVPVGRDAAVAYGLLDFKFVNNTGSYVLLKTAVQGNGLTVKVFGNDSIKKSVHINSWITKTIKPKTTYKIDPAVAPGQPRLIQKGSEGYRVASERVVLEGGREVERESLPASYYQPVEEIVAVNSKAEIPGQDQSNQQQPPALEDQEGGNPATQQPPVQEDQESANPTTQEPPGQDNHEAGKPAAQEMPGQELNQSGNQTARQQV